MLFSCSLNSVLVLGCGFVLMTIRCFITNGVYNTNTWLLLFDFMFIVLMTTAHEEPGGGQDGGCVDEVTQQTLSK